MTRAKADALALRVEQKEAIVADLRTVTGRALSAVLADYRGMNVGELTDLRRRARASGVYLRVVRNTLLQRAIAGTQYEGLGAAAVGPTMLALSTEDPGAAARLLKDAADEFDALAVKALAVDGRVYGAAEIDRLASLPTREQAIAQLMATFQAPIAKLARTLQEVPAKVTRLLAAVRDKKAEAG